MSAEVGIGQAVRGTRRSERSVPSRVWYEVSKFVRKKPLGAALYSSSSQIALRMVASKPLASRAEWIAVLRQRVATAIAYRKEVVEAKAYWYSSASNSKPAGSYFGLGGA